MMYAQVFIIGLLLGGLSLHIWGLLRSIFGKLPQVPQPELVCGVCETRRQACRHEWEDPDVVPGITYAEARAAGWTDACPLCAARGRVVLARGGGIAGKVPTLTLTLKSAFDGDSLWSANGYEFSAYDRDDPLPELIVLHLRD